MEMIGRLHFIILVLMNELPGNLRLIDNIELYINFNQYLLMMNIVLLLQKWMIHQSSKIFID